ncbi:sensor histidine kinase [Fictibacillus fluitans]|uniref:histidine kinase n=1 Tax=Fictibacillus fluitans TaxID=3058422 RepID=A0ABT8HYY3_9BACL|nr:sensor histidine kinase [Fictibacillus sp. NE201]MDN4525982.1 sensor histidine kinase [Fictibacillus sp. NE201]
MNINIARYFNQQAVHITFIVIFFILILPDHPSPYKPILIFHAIFAACYVWMAMMLNGQWNFKRFFLVVCVLAALIFIVRLLFSDYPDHRMFWPMLYLLGTAHSKWNRSTVILAVFTVCFIFFLMLIDGLSFGALIAAVLMYAAVRNQSLLREAHDKNEKQLQQLNDAYSELQQSSIHTMRYAALTERTRLARDIHDGLGHHMTSLIVQLQALKLMISKEPAAAEESVDDILKIARNGLEEIRSSVKEWSNDEKGLGPVALQGLVSLMEGHSLMKIAYKETGIISEWTVECSVILYRILQEALTNILKHADATEVNIIVKEENEYVEMLITDDGHFSSEKPLNLGFGLSGMMERCKSAGGSIHFSANSPKGLKIKAKIPLNFTASV